MFYVTRPEDHIGTLAITRCEERLQQIIDIFRQTIHELNQIRPQTDEFQRVTSLLLTDTRRAASEYQHLLNLLQQALYEQYNDTMSQVPSFFQRFDTNSYDTVATALLDSAPEDQFATDLYHYMY